MIRRTPALLALATALAASSALAQDASAPATPKPDAPTAGATPAPVTPQLIDPYMPPRSVYRPSRTTRTSPHASDTAGGYHDPDADYGFRNPGGIGKMSEFYPPGNTFANGGHDPIHAATFNGGSGVPTTQDQAQAQQLGVNKQRELDNRINSLARPIGFGYGFGFGAGFGGFPY